MKNPGSFAAPKRVIGADRRRRERGTAALEFALVAPLLLLLIGGVANYGWAMWSAGALSNAVSQGAYYSFLNGTKVSAASIESFVQSASGLSGVTATATTPAWDCVSGTNPTTLAAAAASTTACPDGTMPGLYSAITATYTSPTFMPMFDALKVTQTAEVRLK